MEKKCYIVTIQYDGRRYFGWRRQKHEPLTIQQVMEDTLRQMTGLKVNLHAASWTDTGVHALGQVAAMVIRQTIEPTEFARQANTMLPPDIRISGITPAPRGFDPIGGNFGKHYRYILTFGPADRATEKSWHLSGRPDLNKMQQAAAKLVGTHDFKGIKSAKDRRSDCVRTITKCQISSENNEIYIDFFGDNFIYLMIRTLTAALVEIGLGHKDTDFIDLLLLATDNRYSPPPAPGQGLCLHTIYY